MIPVSVKHSLSGGLLRFSEVIPIHFLLQGILRLLHMYPPYLPRLFLGFLGFHFIYKGIISQKLILIVAFINVLFYDCRLTNTFKWLLLKKQTNLFINFTQKITFTDLYLLIFSTSY
jgi:hypothetical protein